MELAQWPLVYLGSIHADMDTGIALPDLTRSQDYDLPTIRMGWEHVLRKYPADEEARRELARVNQEIKRRSELDRNKGKP